MGESLLRALARRWWVPVLTVTAGVASAVWWTSGEPRVYRVSAMLAVVPVSTIGDADVLHTLDTLERRTLLVTFARLPATKETRVAVAKQMERDPRELTGYEIAAAVVPSTNIIRIDVDGPNPELAARIANVAGEIVSAEGRSLYRICTMRSIAAAESSTRPVYPDPQRNSLAAGVLGLFVGTVAVGLTVPRRGKPGS